MAIRWQRRAKANSMAWGHAYIYGLLLILHVSSVWGLPHCCESRCDRYRSRVRVIDARELNRCNSIGWLGVSNSHPRQRSSSIATHNRSVGWVTVNTAVCVVCALVSCHLQARVFVLCLCVAPGPVVAGDSDRSTCALAAPAPIRWVTPAVWAECDCE